MSKIPSDDPYLARIGRRYFERLNEVLVDRFPEISPINVPEKGTLADFYPAVQNLSIKNDLPGLGIEFGYRIRVSDYGVVGLATASTSCLAEAIETQMRFLAILTVAEKLAYRLTQKNKLMELAIKQSTVTESLDRFLIESELAAQLRFIGDLLPTEKPSTCTLHLPYSCPTSPQHYESLLGCRVMFRQSEAKVTFPASWMDKSLQTSDKLLSPLLAERCQSIVARMEVAVDWVMRVRNYLLISGKVMQGLGATADALDIPIHTLRWRLYKNGTSYKKITHDVRMQLACQYLEDTHLTLQQIGYQLGYSQPSNFQLAFKRYFDIPPAQWRLSERHFSDQK